MRILLLGDVHGRLAELQAALRQGQTDYRIAAAVQVGDFGFYEEVITRARQQRIRFPVPLHVIDGNHEDHRWLHRALRSGFARIWEQELNLIYQPRPSTALLGATRIGFMGGALHVDRPQRHNFLSRFPNYILKRQREHAAAVFNRDRPDLIVTHSCPARIGIGLRGAPDLSHNVSEHICAAGFDPGPEEDCGEIELARLWCDLSFRPRAWVFGHFHRGHQTCIEGTDFICLGEDLTSPDRRLAIWDTEEKKLLFCPADPSRPASGALADGVA
jgi:predicted phosphodiesterase